MGRPGSISTAVVSVNVDDKGEVKYDAIVKQGSNRNKIVKTSLDDMKESAGDSSKLDLPSKEEEESVTDATRKALETLLNGKIKKAKPTGPTSAAADTEEPKYIRYTPNPNLPGSVFWASILPTLRSLSLSGPLCLPLVVGSIQKQSKELSASLRLRSTRWSHQNIALRKSLEEAVRRLCPCCTPHLAV
jgi:hypothetical protein